MSTRRYYQIIKYVITILVIIVVVLLVMWILTRFFLPFLLEQIENPQRLEKPASIEYIDQNPFAKIVEEPTPELPEDSKIIVPPIPNTENKESSESSQIELPQSTPPNSSTDGSPTPTEDSEIDTTFDTPFNRGSADEFSEAYNI